MKSTFSINILLSGIQRKYRKDDNNFRGPSYYRFKDNILIK